MPFPPGRTLRSGPMLSWNGSFLPVDLAEKGIGKTGAQVQLELLMNARPPQIRINNERPFTLLGMGNCQMDNGRRLSFTGRRASQQKRPHSSLEIGQQNRVPECSNRLFIRGYASVLAAA